MWEIYKENNGDLKMIEMTIGDTPCFKVECMVRGENNELEPYVPEPGDEFVFACKRNKSDSRYIFKILINNEDMTCQFRGCDTRGLEPGKYYFEVSLNKPSIGYHCTFITNKILKLTEEMY